MISNPSVSRNKSPILDVLAPRIEILRNKTENQRPIKILEIASGTGEHAAHFASAIPNILYQPTEPNNEMHSSISAWCSTLSPGIVYPPLSLDVLQKEEEIHQLLAVNGFYPSGTDVLICINMIHISPIAATYALMNLVKKCIQPHGFLLTYGPYRVYGSMVQSNLDFDENLKSRNSEWGIRDIEQVDLIAQQYNLHRIETISMPANNLCVIFQMKEEVSMD